MSQRFRVFGLNDVQPAPAALADELRRRYVNVSVHVRGDDLGWFTADFVCAHDPTLLRLERFLAKEDEIRADLNSWAAWLESIGEGSFHLRLMQHIIGTTQLFTLEWVNADNDATEPAAEALAVHVCQFLARMTDGIYQVDRRGLFAADGTLLIAEEPEQCDR